MLDECIEYLEERSSKTNFTYEIIVVSDGSVDGTVKKAYEYCKKIGSDKFRILALEKNRGKGGAVRLVCCCKYISFYTFNVFFLIFRGYKVLGVHIFFLLMLMGPQSLVIYQN